MAPNPPTLATGPAQPVRCSTWSPCPGLNRRPRPYQGRALPSELHGRRLIPGRPRHGPQIPQRSQPARHSRSGARFLRTWSGKRDSNPRPPAWKAGALPLSYSREWKPPQSIDSMEAPTWPPNPQRSAAPWPSRGAPRQYSWWGGEDLNPRRRLPADLQSAPFGHLGTSPIPPACLRIPPNLLKTLALAGGFEPPTHCLQGSCSATELRQHRQNFTLVSLR
jgi:hypothetical protein